MNSPSVDRGGKRTSHTTREGKIMTKNNMSHSYFFPLVESAGTWIVRFGSDGDQPLPGAFVE